MMNRIEWIDWCKSLAIFFVVWLHVHSDFFVDMIINSFIMPLFFIISGYLFKYENNPSGRDFFIKRFRQLIVPYLWINVVAYFLWVLVLRNYGSNTLDEIEWHTPLIAIFTGVGPLLVHDIPLWSLLSFFVVEMLFYFFCCIVGKWYWIFIGSLVCFSLLVILLPETVGSLPIVLGPSVAGLCFYSLGYGWREDLAQKIYFVHSEKKKFFCKLVILFISIAIFVPAVTSIGNISFYTCKIGNLPGFYFAGLTGAIVVIIFSQFISGIGMTPFFIRMISVGTLLICGFHLIVFAAIKGVALIVFKIQPEALIHGFFSGLILAIEIVVFTMPIIWVIRKYARFLVDK